MLARYDVRLLLCSVCQSLQTEDPYWLAEAYDDAIARTDTGAVARNLDAHAAIVAAARVLRVRGRLLDFGGGAGLLCRLLRDSGFDAYMCDKFADAIYARHYVLQLDDVAPGSVSLLSAIEVLEHCRTPATELPMLFLKRPEVLFATTFPYEGQGPDWWYLGTQSGQHVFFYSTVALQKVARSHGYHYFGSSYFHVFTLRPISGPRKLMLRALMTSIGLKLVRTWLALTRRPEFFQRDHDRLTQRGPRG